MLIHSTKEQFMHHFDWLYDLSLQPCYSGYPIYYDGIKTKSDFIERSLKAFEHLEEQLPLFQCEDVVEGMIHLYWDPVTNYLSTVCSSIRRNVESVIQALLDYVQINFAGYEMWLGFSEDNIEAIRLLTNHDFECIEQAYHTTAYLDDISFKPSPI